MSLLCWFFLLSVCSFSACANEVWIAFNETLAPFADKETDRGLEIDIVRAALLAAGHALKPAYFPRVRTYWALKEREVDGVATLNADSGLNAFYSEVYIRYQNIAVARKGKFNSIGKIADLVNLKVIAFPQASVFLGAEFAEMTKSNLHYSEVPDHQSEVRMLFGEVAEVIVIEQHIFDYQVQTLLSSKFNERPFEVDKFYLFSETPYQVAFRNALLKDEFNGGLMQIRQNGILECIEAAYRSGKNDSAQNCHAGLNPIRH